MNINIVKIGNSRGIRIPRKVLDRCHIEEEVSLEIQDEKIILTPIRRKPREGWEQLAKSAHEKGDDTLLIPDSFPDDEDFKW